MSGHSALGILQDNSYLIYAVGDVTLASALANGGAYSAMQLDINSGMSVSLHINKQLQYGRPLIGSTIIERDEQRSRPYISTRVTEISFI